MRSFRLVVLAASLAASIAAVPAYASGGPGGGGGGGGDVAAAARPVAPFKNFRTSLFRAPSHAEVVPYTYAGTKRAQMTDASGTTANYTYDALNRLATVQENNTGTTAYGYDNVGNLQSVTYPNSVAQRATTHGTG